MNLVALALIIGKCYTVENYGPVKYKELRMSENLELTLVQTDGVKIHAKNPAVDEVTLNGGCYGTQGGGWICRPDVTVPLYQYNHPLVDDVWFQKDLRYGVLRLVQGEFPLRLWEKACE